MVVTSDARLNVINVYNQPVATVDSPLHSDRWPLGCNILFVVLFGVDYAKEVHCLHLASQSNIHRSHGGKNQHSDNPSLLDNIQEAKAPTGTSKDAALRRLRKDRADLHEKVIAGEISAHAAMIDAGFRKKPTQAEICVKAFRKAENRMEAMRLITSELEPHEAAVVRDWIVERLH